MGKIIRATNLLKPALKELLSLHSKNNVIIDGADKLVDQIKKLPTDKLNFPALENLFVYKKFDLI
jgi:hypothetical protein